MTEPSADRPLRDNRADTALRRADLLVAAVVTAVFIVLAVLRSARTDITGDEMWTRTIMRLPLSETWAFIVRDGKHPPLYLAFQILLAPLTADTATGMRAISMLAGGLMPGALFLFARRLGVPAAAACIAAVWVGANPALREHAVEARSYALFALLILCHAGATTIAVVERRRSFAYVGAALALLAIVTHAFGLLFLGATCAALLACALASPRRDELRTTFLTLFRMHAACAFVFAGWYLFVVLASRGTTGITAGLEWVAAATTVDRIYSLGEVLGSSPYVGSTRIVLGLWAVVAATVLLATRGVTRLASGLVIVALLAPYLAQQLASGLLVDLPVSGTKHIIGMLGPVALAVTVGARQVGVARWWSRPSLVALAAVAALALVTGPVSGAGVLSGSVARFRQMPSRAGIRAVYEYGDLSVLNYYLDRACVDDAQLRAQFPDVKGAPDFAQRSSHCVARPATVVEPESVDVVLLSWRPWVTREVQRRDSMQRAGWQLVNQMRAGRHDPVVDELHRAPRQVVR